MTPIVSVAANVDIGTVREEEVVGIVKEEMEGEVESDTAGLGSFIKTIDVYGRRVTLVAYFAPVTSIMGSVNVTTLFEVVALYSKWRSFRSVMETEDL